MSRTMTRGNARSLLQNKYCVLKRLVQQTLHNTPQGKELLRIPGYAFLYLLGNAEKHGYRGME